MSDDMRKFNQLVEEADKITNYQFDRASVWQLVVALDDSQEHGRLADDLYLLAIELGLWHSAK